MRPVAPRRASFSICYAPSSRPSSRARLLVSDRPRASSRASCARFCAAACSRTASCACTATPAGSTVSSRSHAKGAFLSPRRVRLELPPTHHAALHAGRGRARDAATARTRGGARGKARELRSAERRGRTSVTGHEWRSPRESFRSTATPRTPTPSSTGASTKCVRGRCLSTSRPPWKAPRSSCETSALRLAIRARGPLTRVGSARRPSPHSSPTARRHGRDRGHTRGPHRGRWDLR